MTKDLQGSSHHLKVVGEAYGKRKDFIYEIVSSLKKRLEHMYAAVTLGNVKGIAWFICRKECHAPCTGYTI